MRELLLHNDKFLTGAWDIAHALLLGIRASQGSILSAVLATSALFFMARRYKDPYVLAVGMGMVVDAHMTLVFVLACLSASLYALQVLLGAAPQWK